MTASSPTSFVLLGSVDHGKSSLAGSMLIYTNTVSERDIAKAKEDSVNNKMSGWWLAYLLDVDESERMTGKTHSFTTTDIIINSTTFQLVDVPGHQKLITEMIHGVSHADLGVLVCSARKGELEQGLRGQTYEHCLIAKGMGVNKLIVAVNKMDTVDNDMKEYERIVTTVSEKLKPLGFISIDYVPVSALTQKGIGELCEKIASTPVKKNRPGNVDVAVTDSFVGRVVFMETSDKIFSRGYECALHSGDLLINVEIASISKKGKPLRFITGSSQEGTYTIKFRVKGSYTLKTAFVLRDGDVTVAVGRI